MRKLLLLALVISPNIAYASDPTGLLVVLGGMILIVAVITITFVIKTTKELEKSVLKRLLRVFSITLFFSPTGALDPGYILPSGILIFFGDYPEKLYVFVSVIVCTAIGYLIYKSLESDSKTK